MEENDDDTVTSQDDWCHPVAWLFGSALPRSYLEAVIKLAEYCPRSPDQSAAEEQQPFFLYLAKDRGLSAATCRLYLNAIRFLYLHVLGRDSFGVTLVMPKRAQGIPELLTQAEVGRILSACRNFTHRMLLTTCYSCGLGVSEVVALKVRDLDGERHLLRVERGKGRDGETKRSCESFRRRAGSPWTGQGSECHYQRPAFDFAIAVLILEELEDECRWDEAFAKLPDVLAMLTEEAFAEDRTGRTQELDPDEL